MGSSIGNKNLLMDEKTMTQVIGELVDTIIAEFPKNELNELLFIGIQAKGVVLASRFVDIIQKKTGCSPPLGKIDITMYRDDIGMRKVLPIIHETDIPVEMNERKIILVDDVLETGRTIRAALDAITDYGRPDLIRLAVLIDRGHREFPIRADYNGKTIQVPLDKHIQVRWNEIDGQDSVYEIDITSLEEDVLKK